jgi:predicted nucleic acid-binding protein
VNKNENILTGYCFLAALTENQNDLYNQVYIPICKRTLSLYSLQDRTHGGVSDIKELIAEEYGIDVPSFVVKKLINATFKSLSNRSRKRYKFNVFQNGETFEIEKYAFSDLEIDYKKGKRNAKALQEAFDAYLKSEDLDVSDVPNFSAFLDKNKRHLAAFFRNTGKVNGDSIETSFIHHVSFLEHIETSNHNLFEIAKGLFIGSIVAGFLESGIDLEPKIENNEVYYLDTPIVLRALDLQKEEETQPIRELLDIIKNTGGKVKILSITLNEISNVIANAIGNYHSSIPTSTINEACLRLGKHKAWLITYNGNLEKNILETLKIEKESIQDSFIEKNQTTPDVKALQERRIRKGNALHDVLSYLYVRQQRSSSVTLFQKAKVWFLSNNTELLRFNREFNPQGGITEIVMPDALTGLLWLKNPTKLIGRVKSVGLSELMAITLNEEIASKELINEFETTIKSIDGISQDDYRVLLESVAHESAKKIEQFNEVAEKDKGEAKVLAHRIVEKERSRRAKNQKEIKEAQTAQKNAETVKIQEESKNRQLQEHLEKIEHELKEAKNQTDSTQTQIEKLSEAMNLQGRLVRKYTMRLWIGFAFLVAFILIIIFRENIDNVWKYITGLLTMSGWLWGLGSFLINSYKLAKGK